MWPNPFGHIYQIRLVTFTEEILNRKLYFLCSDTTDFSSENDEVSIKNWFKTCLPQQFFASKDFCMEERLCSIFKTPNAITLFKTLESPYQILQDSWKENVFKQLVQFSNTVQY